MLTLRRKIGPPFLFLLFSIAFTCLSAKAADSASSTGWRIPFQESGSDPVIVDGLLYLGSADGAVYALDPNTGQTKWRFQTGANLSSGPQLITVPKGTSLGGQMTAAMQAVDRLKQSGTARVDMIPAINQGTVFVGSGDHLFYAIDAATGEEMVLRSWLRDG